MRTQLSHEATDSDPIPRHFNKRREAQSESAHLPLAPSLPEQNTTTLGHDFSSLRIFPERSETLPMQRPTLADPPENVAPAPVAPTPNQQPAPSAAVPPVMQSGEVEITDGGNSFSSEVAYFAAMTVYDVQSDFTVETKNVKVQSDSPGAFVFGLVQNVLFDHFEATYSRGDVLVDSVGPLLDIWPTDPAPFFHEGGGDNPVYPTSLFTQLFVGAKFTDKPSWPLKPRALFCNEEVKLKSATRSIAFRVGLVARDVGTGQLYQLGATAKTYMIKWRADIDTDTAARTLTSNNQLAGTYALDNPGITLQLAPPTAVTEVNKATDTATEDMESRCDNVL